MQSALLSISVNLRIEFWPSVALWSPPDRRYASKSAGFEYKIVLARVVAVGIAPAAKSSRPSDVAATAPSESPLPLSLAVKISSGVPVRSRNYAFLVQEVGRPWHGRVGRQQDDWGL